MITGPTWLVLAALVFGALGVAVFATIIALRIRAVGRGYGPDWRGRAVDMDRRLADLDSVFGAYPGLVMVWPKPATNKPSAKDKATTRGWGDPKMLGSPAALASIRRFAGPVQNAKAPAPLAARILVGLGELDLIGERPDATLRALIGDLRTQGEAFTASILMPEGNALELQGRVAGTQSVLWIEDAALRGVDEGTAIGRFESHRRAAVTDPVAFIEMMSRAPYPMWRVNNAGRISWANDAYLKAIGVADLQQVVAEQIQLDDRAAQQAVSTISQQTRQTATRRVVIGGQNRNMKISLFPIAGGAAGVAMDATEAEALREALSRHIRAHDDTLNHLDTMVAVFGSAGRARFYNTAFAEAFGLPSANSIAKGEAQITYGQWLDHARERRLLPEQVDYARWKAEALDLFSDWPGEVPDELWAIPDGRTFRLTRLRDAQGGVSVMLSDMTDRLDLQSQLGTQINVQTATMDRLSEGIAVFGADGRLRLSNTAFRKIWNVPQGLPDPHFSDIIEFCMPLYHDRAFWEKMVARVTDPDPTVRQFVEDEITRADGMVLRWLSRPLPDGATLMVWDDRTQSRRAEAALIERTEALEAADRMKSEFVGHVSYQLRTPLTTITGYADLMQSGGAGELSDKQSEYVFAIQQASEELAKTIDDILDIAAIEANVLDLDLGDVDLHAVLEHSLDYVATRAEDTRIEVALDCDPAIGMIRADEVRLKQVVYNLLLNALRFTKPGGRVELGAARADGGVRIWVKDTGVGIPLGRQPKVFESFESSRGGAGLGLALVQRFIERHGGWVELESEEGKGTHVTCYLPATASSNAAQPELDLAS